MKVMPDVKRKYTKAISATINSNSQKSIIHIFYNALIVI